MQSTQAPRRVRAGFSLLGGVLVSLRQCALFLCLALLTLPAMAAPDWARWQADIARLHRESLPEETIRQRLQDVEARLPPNPPYPVQREIALVRIRLAEDHQQTSEARAALRRLATEQGDVNTVHLMQIGEIFDSHSDANIEVSLHALDEVRLNLAEASLEVRDAMAIAYAYMYWDVGNFELALRHLLHARELARQLPVADPTLVAERGETVARLYVDMHNATRALEMLTRVDRAMPATASTRLRTHLLATRAAAYTLSGRGREAVALLVPALKRVPASEPSNATQRLRQELARAYFELDDPARALTVATAMVDASAEGSPYFKAEGEVLQGAAEASLGRVDSGLATMQLGLDHFEKAAHVVALQQGLNRKVAVLAAAGRDREAFAALQEQHALLLRLYDSNRAQGVASLQVEEDIARREREIRNLSLANSLQQAKLDRERIRSVALMLASFLAIGLVVLLGLLLHATRQQRKALWKDALTGAFNRHYLQQWLRDRKQQKDSWRAVALLDLDHFKVINDRHGHAAGDAVLHQAGHRLRERIGKHGEVFRWGGEEFLLVQDFAKQADVETWLHDLLQAFAQPIVHADASMQVTASIGCVLVPAGADADIESFELASRVADVGMYQAKAEGRGRAVWLLPTEAGIAAWPWNFAITPETLRDWQAKGWVDARTVLPISLPQD